MSSLRSVHLHDRQKIVAAVDPDLGLFGPCCQSELSCSSLERRYHTALEVSREYGKRCCCNLCGDRILDDLGLPLELMER